MKTWFKIIDKGKDFIYINPLCIEITWWKRSYMGRFIYPAFSICRTGNTKGIKIHFWSYTIDFSYYFEEAKKKRSKERTVDVFDRNEFYS